MSLFLFWSLRWSFWVGCFLLLRLFANTCLCLPSCLVSCSQPVHLLLVETSSAAHQSKERLTCSSAHLLHQFSNKPVFVFKPPWWPECVWCVEKVSRTTFHVSTKTSLRPPVSAANDPPVVFCSCDDEANADDKHVFSAASSARVNNLKNWKWSQSPRLRVLSCLPGPDISSNAWQTSPAVSGDHCKEEHSWNKLH